MNAKLRIAIIATHPIQHFCPQYASFAKNENVCLKVFFASTAGYEKYIDPVFKKEISWGNLGLDRFDHLFLNGSENLELNHHIDAPDLNHKLTEFAPDLVVCYGYTCKVQRRAAEWARKNKKTLAHMSDGERRQHRGFWKETIKRPLLQWVYRKYDYFLTVGNANEEYYEYYGVPAEKMIRMHYPIDAEYYSACYAKKAQLRTQIREQYNIPEATIVVSMVGKLVPRKRQGDIIDALIRLDGATETYCALLIGTGEKLAEWKKKAEQLKKNRVIFTDFVNVEDLPSYYAASDIYLHCSEKEPHSVAVSEALFMGCPIVISDRCGSYGPTDDVQLGKNGWTFGCGDIDDLAGRIEALGGNNAQRLQFSETSHQLGVSFQQQSHFGALNLLLQKKEPYYIGSALERVINF